MSSNRDLNSLSVEDHASAERAQTLRVIETTRVIAIVRADTQQAAIANAKTLIKYGIKVLEVSLTTPSALDAIEELTELSPSTLVGAGTVLSAKDVERVVRSGARFVLSPVVDPAVINLAREQMIPVIPGAATPTEVLTGIRLGADAIKLFPATSLGTGHLRALREVFPGSRFVPTGGINPQDAAAWLRAGAWALGIGRGAMGVSGADTENAVRLLLAAAGYARSHEPQVPGDQAS